MTNLLFIMLTFDRLQYTKEAVSALLKNDSDFHLTLFDNGSTEPGMREYLEHLPETDDRVIDVHSAGKNLGLSIPTNMLWKQYRDVYPFIGKIDNDTLIPPDGVKRIMDVMSACPNIHICHGHHWLAENFKPRRLKEIDGRVHLTAKWGGGCFYVMRSSIIDDLGYISDKHGLMGGWTRYQIRARRRGYGIVYAYPLIKVRHLGDPDSGREEETGAYRDYNEYIRKHRTADFSSPGQPVDE